jgi:eukaryotic-like serine/threonine-protein kinase
MGKKRIYGLDFDQVGRLLLLGAEGPDQARDGDAVLRRTCVEGPGAWIGRYRLVRILGEGGMGIVYLAEQEQPLSRQVALKIVKPGMDSRRVIARFEAERQALALLDHPGIAQVHDAGTTSSGLPYFVMEYVKGIPITDYCDRHKLCIEDRLRLFQRVCLAVHHAHQKGIIHRDLKPSNILVSAENDRPTPKIIDFGVAKAMSQPLTDRTLVTEDSQLIGTPEYISPEQADMLGEDIDIRSGVYSLGVLLYVLLIGVLPFDPKELRDSGIEHIRKTIRETDPKTPSTRLTKLGEEARRLAESRRTEAPTLAKRLHRELEWIPLKAMRKERAERYRSTSEFADDIGNYLNGDPLIAGPLTAGYRLKKSVRRNRALVAGAITVFVALTMGLVVSAGLYFRAERLRVEAQQAVEREAVARAESETVITFLQQDVLNSAGTIKGRDATVADVFDVASNNLEGKFQDQPLVEARIRYALGMAYRGLGDHGAAIRHLARSYQVFRDQLGEDERRTRYAKNNLALAYYGAGHYGEAERFFDELIEAGQRSNPENADWLGTLKGNRACVYIEQARYREAESFFLTSLETETPWWESWAKHNPYLLHLADVYLYQGRYGEAEQLFNQFRDPSDDNPLKARLMPRLGYLYMAEERYDGAEDLFARGIEYSNREKPGKDHPLTLAYMNGLGVLRMRQHHYDEAERLLDEVLEARKRRLGEDHATTLETINELGVLRREQGDYEQAESLLRQALNGRQQKLGFDHPACFESMHELALVYIAQKDYEKAEPLLLDAYNGREAKLGSEHPHTIESLKQLVSLYEAWDKPGEAEKWRVKLAPSAVD